MHCDLGICRTRDEGAWCCPPAFPILDIEYGARPLARLCSSEGRVTLVWRGKGLATYVLARV